MPCGNHFLRLALSGVSGRKDTCLSNPPVLFLGHKSPDTVVQYDASILALLLMTAVKKGKGSMKQAKREDREAGRLLEIKYFCFKSLCLCG